MSLIGWKLVHEAAVILFLGNIVTGMFWARHASRTRDLKAVAVVFDGLVRSDKWITLPSVVVVVATGIALARTMGLTILGTGWLAWASLSIALSGVVFGLRVAPMQARIRDFAKMASGSPEDWATFERLQRRWAAYGLSSIAAACLPFVLMLWKPAVAGLSRLP